MGGLLHLVQRGGDWAGPQPAQAPPRCTKCNSQPITGQCTNHRIAVSYRSAVKWLNEAVCLSYSPSLLCEVLNTSPDRIILTELIAADAPRMITNDVPQSTAICEIVASDDD